MASIQSPERRAAELRRHDAGELPGAALAAEKMPGHWLLARLGKRVLRPGGVALTRWLIDSLDVSDDDSIVELAPGLGQTAQLLLQTRPRSYTGVERDPAAAAQVAAKLNVPAARCVVGSAEATGQPGQCATVVLAEAMLSMQPDLQKQRIIAEAHRLLAPQGRFAIHELCLTPDDLSAVKREEIEHDLSQVIHVGAKPLSARQWRELVEDQGFEMVSERRSPMHLLELHRMIQDEGLARFVRIAFNICRDGEARQRVRSMRQVFRRHGLYLAALGLIARKIQP